MSRFFLRTLLLTITLLFTACQNGRVNGSESIHAMSTKAGVSATKTQPAPVTEATTAVAQAPQLTNASSNITPTETVSSTVTQASLSATWPSQLPILTADTQDMVYGPGQVVIAFAKNYQPGENIAIALIHETQGIVANKSATADALGNVQTGRRLKQTPTEQDGLPAGKYTYRFTGTSQTQTFTFQVDYQHRPYYEYKSCRYFPSKAVFEGALAFFCSGLKPNTKYTLTTRMDDKMDAIITASDPFGLVIFPLRLTSKTLSPGDWQFSLGETTDQVGKPLDLGFPPLTIHILSSTEITNP